MGTAAWWIWKRPAAAFCKVGLSPKWDRREAFALPPYYTSEKAKAPVSEQSKMKELRKFVREFKGEEPNENAEQEKVVSLCRTLNAKADTSEVVKNWIADGNVMSRDVAAKLMNVVREERLVEMTSKLYMQEISQLCLQLGPSKGEALFRSMPESLRTEEVTTAFLTAVAKEDDSARAERLMDELNSTLSVDAWSAVLHMYLRRDRHDKLRDTYYRFKQKGLKPVLFTYWLVLQCRERVGGFEEIEMEFDAELKRTNFEEADTRLLNLIMRSYALLGKRKMVDRMWTLLKSEQVAAPDLNSYVSAIKSFGLFGDLEKAYEVLEEVLQKFERIPQNPYIWIVEICVRLKMMDQAEKLMEKHIGKSCFLPYNFLVTGYVETCQISSALKKLDEAFEIPFKDRKLFYKTVMALLPVFAKRGDIHSAEKLISNYGSCGDVKVYNALLNVYVSTKRMPTNVLHRMKNHNIEPNEETWRLMDTLESFWDHKPGRSTVWRVVNGRRIPRDQQMAHLKFSREGKDVRNRGLIPKS
ncbi:pentatricopeptide repeat-containing protein At1g80270, mitochondrial-like [Selaginella moellendorffii]|uniref:pentatricopeptide repeat-containing protein At1g80270, mitochondrial-like n=1 Tax=Selaginella moellendorffii TaxID=88036 RepID=UPI000D1C7CD4|nr:pentatricopeptide repeat-containing protein At1g80270, mitochondrial-like [Selaginella moellendorffii]|eukprot:XP_024526537.1 pentatricopeptide repeat-containing protein At1g80270, mitochondrial-like [Selaginella moellendorffii]